MSEIPDLAISAEKLAAILAKARQFDVKDVVTDPNPGSNQATMRCCRFWKITPTIPCGRN